MADLLEVIVHASLPRGDVDVAADAQEAALAGLCLHERFRNPKGQLKHFHVFLVGLCMRGVVEVNEHVCDRDQLLHHCAHEVPFAFLAREMVELEIPVGIFGIRGASAGCAATPCFLRQEVHELLFLQPVYCLA